MIRPGREGRFLFLAGLLISAALTHARAATLSYEYYLLNPRFEAGELQVMSLADENEITLGGTTLMLERNALGTVPAGVDLAPGTVLRGTGPFAPAGEVDATDLPVPGGFIGTRFVIPHTRNDHTYYLLSPFADAQASIFLSGLPTMVALPQGQLVSFEAGADNRISGLIRSDQPILVSHTAHGGRRDAYPVPPVAQQLWGVRSRNAVVSALEDDTTVMVYTSDGFSDSFVLNAGLNRKVTSGSNASQGRGAGMHLLADKPIAAIQVADADGVESTAFFPQTFLGMQYGIPVDTQYLAVVCPHADTTVTLIDGLTFAIQDCAGSSTYPGKAYFGSPVNGVNIHAGAVLSASRPVYVIYETSASNDEHNLLGHSMPASFERSRPRLETLPRTTSENPLLVTGHAAPGSEVHLYVNGIEQDTGRADSVEGGFSFRAILVDAHNKVHVTVSTGDHASAASEIQSVDFRNTIERTQVDTVISRDTVWTPGSVPEPYLISGTLTVNAGAQLILQPGVELRFSGAAVMEVEGGLDVRGIPARPVVFTSAATDPVEGDWQGIRVSQSATRVAIESARIEWAANGIDIDGADFRVLDSEVVSFRDSGIRVQFATGGLIEGNTIHRGNAGVRSWQWDTGIYLIESSVRVADNTIEATDVGIHVDLASSPLIEAGNRIRDNRYGLYLTGDSEALANNPAPVITNNVITANREWNLRADGFAEVEGQRVELNVQGNWWGSADPGEILKGIYSYKDSPGNTSPLVRTAPYRDGPEGGLTGEDYISGFLAEDTKIRAAQTFRVMGSLVVPASMRLTLEPGAQMRFVASSGLFVHGTLRSEGSAAQPVVMMADGSLPERGSWRGVSIKDSGGNAQPAPSSRFVHTLVLHAQTGILITGAEVPVTNSVIAGFSNFGIRLDEGAGGLISGNSLLAGDGIAVSVYASLPDVTANSIQDVETGIYVRHASPRIEGNTLEGSMTGIYIDSVNTYEVTNPVIGHDNMIRNNEYGIYVRGDSQPLVRGNRIVSNHRYNYFATRFSRPHETILDATGNWWGTHRPAEIVAGIHDYAAAGGSSPVVDFSPFLDAPNGSLIESELLYGLLSQDRRVSAGEVLSVAGGVVVPEGLSLMLEAGVLLEFPAGTGLSVQGDLIMNGQRDKKVRLTAANGESRPHRWAGVVISGSGVREIRHSVIDSAEKGIEVLEGDLLLQESVLENNRTGVEFTGRRIQAENNILRGNDTGLNIHHSYDHLQRPYPSGEITGNEIKDNRTGLRLDIIEASQEIFPTIVSGNHIRNNRLYGVEIYRQCNAYLTANLITGNDTGVFVGGGSLTLYPGLYRYQWDPDPVITGNNIVANTRYNYLSSGFSNKAARLDARHNWWGSAAGTDIEAGIYHSPDDAWQPTVLYEPARQTPVLMPPVLSPSIALTNQPVFPLSGRADSNTRVDIIVNGGYPISTITDSQGEFTARIELHEGLNRLYATSVAGEAESQPSAELELSLDTAPPAVVITDPAGNGNTRQPEQWVRGVLGESANLKVDGRTVPVDSDRRFVYGPVKLIEGANTLHLEAVDTAGNITQRVLTIRLDTRSPATPERTHLTASEQAGPVLALTAPAGSAEAGATAMLVNARTAETSLQEVDPNGGFAVSLSGQAGDRFYLMLADPAGNSSGWLAYSLSGVAPVPSVAITQPAEGALIASDLVAVHGTVQASTRSSVRVNGVAAIVDNGHFHVSALPLAQGEQNITVELKNPDGSTAGDRIRVASTASARFVFSADEVLGVAPHEATFLLWSDPALDVQGIELDFDGDGLSDRTVLDPDERITHTYSRPGLYQATATLVDAAGETYTSSVTLQIRTLAGVNGILRGVYDGMLNELRDGNVSAAMRYTTGHVRHKYEAIFNELGDRLPQLVDRLGEVAGGAISGDVAEYLVVRNQENQPMVYSVYFLRGRDGLWRIGEM